MNYSAVKRRVWSLLLGILIIVATAGCQAGRKLPPNLDVEGQVAVRGRQVIAAMRGAADATDLAITTGAVTRDDGVPVLQAIHEGSKQAQNLADVLKLIDRARSAVERDGLIQQATDILDDLRKVLDDLVLPVQAEAHRKRIASILQPVKDALFAVALVLPHQKGGPEPEILPGGRMPAVAW